MVRENLEERAAVQALKLTLNDRIKDKICKGGHHITLGEASIAFSTFATHLAGQCLPVLPWRKQKDLQSQDILTPGYFFALRSIQKTPDLVKDASWF